jgi:hypothetical protein
VVWSSQFTFPATTRLFPSLFLSSFGSSLTSSRLLRSAYVVVSCRHHRPRLSQPLSYLLVMSCRSVLYYLGVVPLRAVRVVLLRHVFLLHRVAPLYSSCCLLSFGWAVPFPRCCLATSRHPSASCCACTCLATSCLASPRLTSSTLLLLSLVLVSPLSLSTLVSSCLV